MAQPHFQGHANACLLQRSRLFSKRVIQTKITAPHKCHNYGANHAAARSDSQEPKDPAAQNAPENAQNDISEDAVATTLHNLAGEPTSAQSNHDPCQKSSGSLRSCSSR